ncbi:glycosyltransferase [Neobacillus pocheonensis]|uniref:glycosyltransferase n=1 Tax=Neobacillus pocheonensis TaxID=363869 RepID=UPI003D27F26E
MKSLVILTNRFPYPPGEEFLKNEIDELSKYFSSIKILPTNSEISSNKTEKKQVPNNVEVLPPIKGAKGKVWRTLKLLFDFQSFNWMLKELPAASKFGIRGILKLINWTAITSEMKLYLKKSRQMSLEGEVIYYSYWLTPSAAALAMLKEENPDLYVVSRVHGGDLYLERSTPPYLPFQGKVIQTINQTFSISENGREYLNRHYPDAKGKISVSRLGTKNEFNAPMMEGKSNSLKLISCSYLKSVKRIHLLAKALKYVKVPIEWTHIGDGPERPTIEAIIKELPDQIDVKLVGNLSNDDVIRHYRTHHYDCFLNVSESEGIPVTIMEAFSFGIPVIATDVGGTSELVNSTNGYLLPKDFEPKNLAALLDEMFHLTEKEYQKKSVHAYDTWNNHYNATNNYKKFAETLKGSFQS